MKQSKYVLLSLVSLVVASAGACDPAATPSSTGGAPGTVTNNGGTSSSEDTDASSDGGGEGDDEVSNGGTSAKTTTKSSTKSTKTGAGGSSAKTTAGDPGGAPNEGGAPSEGGAASEGGSGGASDPGGEGGTTTVDEMACEHLALPNGKTDFLDFSTIDATKLNWGATTGDNAGLTGGIALYHGEGDTIAADVSGGNLVATISMAVQGYTGITFWFGPCLDASPYTGISFSIGGTTPAELVTKVMVQTHATYPIDTTNKKGACAWETPEEQWSICSPPFTPFTIPADPTVIEVPFADLTGGKPVDTVDTNELVGMQFQFECASETACDEFNLTIDDIKFY